MNKKPNIDILKEPKGFIKGIELIIAIFAFATVAGFIGHFEFTVRCNGGSVSSREVKGDFFYPFNEIKLYVSDNLCENETTTQANEKNLKINYKSESEYFVFTGVVSMLFVIAAVVYYVFFEDRAKEATSTDIGYCSFPVVDFIFTIVLVIFWFTSSIAWASGLSGLKDATNVDSIYKGYPTCSRASCHTFSGATYGAATVAVVFGFLNFFVWGGNLWFLFKETPWHSPRSSGSKGAGESVPQEPPRQDIPPASAI